MKKAIAAAICACLLLAMAGCGETGGFIKRAEIGRERVCLYPAENML